jgi:predicted Zn-dependent peptidase
VSQSLKRVEDVTLEDAREVAERVLSQPMTLTVLGPFAQRDLAGVMA